MELIEQPLPAAMIEETAWLRERVEIPIIADEAVKRASDIPRLAGAYDGINIKLMKAGGVQEAIRMIHVARALGMKIMLGCMIESSVAISAAAHLSPLVDYADLDGNLLISNDPFTGVGVKRGRLILNDRPGLGVSERACEALCGDVRPMRAVSEDRRTQGRDALATRSQLTRILARVDQVVSPGLSSCRGAWSGRWGPVSP